MNASDFRLDLREVSGALGDLGTLLPLMLGAIAVTDLAPTPVLAGFGIAYCASAIIYRLPVPVQPMKAIVAVLLVSEVTPAALASSGVMLGGVLVVLGATGWIDNLGRLVPQSVIAGLQLGLGLALALTAVGLMSDAPVLGGAALAFLAGLMLFTRLPAALIVVALSMLLGFGLEGATSDLQPTAPPAVTLPDLSELEQAFAELALPQLALTLTNAILLTALVAGDCFGDRARHVTPRRLSLSSGIFNLLFSPWGALPMCHGAGGLVAHHRFGARSGGAPLLLGLALTSLALIPGEAALAFLAAIPVPVLGALLFSAALQLAWSRRLVDSRLSCHPVIAVTAVAVLWVGPFWALVAGIACEVARGALLRRFQGPSSY